MDDREMGDCKRFSAHGRISGQLKQSGMFFIWTSYWLATLLATLLVCVDYPPLLHDSGDTVSRRAQLLPWYGVSEAPQRALSSRKAISATRSFVSEKAYRKRIR